MKSLDIIKNKVTKYTFFYTEPKYFISDLTEKELHNLKQDLEVLEILKALIIHNIKSVGFKSAIVDYKVLVHTGELKQEQLEELEQWLEEEVKE